MNDFQMALIAVGVAALGGVWVYNVWQDRRHRKEADDIFKRTVGAGKPAAGPPTHSTSAAATAAATADDPLLPQNPHTEALIESLSHPGERLEPRLPDVPESPSRSIDDAVSAPPSATAAAEPTAHDAGARKPSSGWTPLPEQWADSVTDCIVRFATPQPVAAPLLWHAYSAWQGKVAKPLRWLACDLPGAHWHTVDSRDNGHYRGWALALQLVDRRGAISTEELAAALGGAQQIAQKFDGILDAKGVPELNKTIEYAGMLDRFCAEVDIQFAIHVFEAGGGAFAGSKLRGAIEAAGLSFTPEGVFRAYETNGSELFTIANLGEERFSADKLKTLTTPGLTLVLDVPRVVDGVAAFDRMLQTAGQLAASLGGVLVDAQRTPLAQPMVSAILAKTTELQQRMREAEMPPGGPRALRLFS
ncbi:MAG TPA: cell division protein ZipA C-terminal FtsZ-binding domain-containing protein [Rhodocyclaceae bacterium]|nr:cell division protein ZipA C-terminal FtsZ-binding domain-containing protein [Rhodocyclaceae bacterium]